MLYTPYTFGSSGLTAPNRIVLAPMTNQQSHADGTLSDEEYRWLVRRAQEGFGIVITCAAHVSPDGQGWPGELGIFDDKFLPGLSRLASGLHQYGSLGIVQLFHGGARSPANLIGQQPWSASAHTMTIGSQAIDVREATLHDISRVIEAFVAAAVRAHQAGFQGVELHAAHGYLLHQFISSHTNQRTDDWGGGLPQRAKLVLSILQRIKATLPAHFLVGVRLSPEDKFTYKGIDFDESLTLAAQLASDGADYLHISPWDAFKKPEKYPESEQTIIEYFRECLPASTPIMVAGAIWSRADADRVLDLGADFAALGRVAIGVPSWPSGAQNPTYEPPKPPYTHQQLQQADLSEVFIQYMKRWQGFVAEP